MPENSEPYAEEARQAEEWLDSLDPDDPNQLVECREVTYEEGRRMLDASARLHLNMSGDEFLAAWDEGRIAETDTLAVQQVASLIPFARKEP